MHDSDIRRWLKLCALDGLDASPHQVMAAQDDLESRPRLRAMLRKPASDFIRWWHGQDVTGWALTSATGSTDWALLALARAANEISESRWGDLS